MKRALGTALVTGLLAFAGCSSPQPLTVWKVSSLKGAKPASCYVDGKITDTDVQTTTVETYVGEWELYDAPNGKYELHVAGSGGTDVYSGDLKSATYTFLGETTDAKSDKPTNPNTTVTVKVTETISLKMAGDTFTGTWSHETVHTCDGGGCSPTYNLDNPDCTTQDELKGTKIPVQVIHQESTWS